MSLAPKVTGISPKEGPPRTKLTIRGENLGVNQYDIISVKICDIECLIFTEWITPQKIITKSPNCMESGPVIVTTKSGGVGTSMIQFRALEQSVGLTTPSGVWVDETDLFPFDSRCSPSALIGNLNGDGSPKVTASNHSAYNDILSESFNPSQYLVDNHSNSSFEELKQVYRSQLEKNQSEPETTLDSNAFLKANIVGIMDCLNALNALYLSFKKDRQEFGSDLTVKIDDYIKCANKEAHSIFDKIILRKDKADSTRNALNVLQRYRFLFNLPSNIDKSMQRKDYDVVINDYFRAKNLFADSSVSVFRKVYHEVEQRIQTFVITLRGSFRQCALSLEDNNIDDLKKLIKYLSQLEDNRSDPAWEAIILIKDSLFDKIADCKEKYSTNKTDAENSATTSSGCNDANETSNGDSSRENPQKPPQVMFIDETSRLFGRIFTDLFKLGCAYMNGDLYNKNTMEDLKKKRELFEKEILIQSIKLLSNEYRSILLPDSNNITYLSNQAPKDIDENLVLWLPYCLRCAVNCYTNLLNLDYNLINIQCSDLLKPMKTFIFDLRVYTLTCLFNHKSNDVKNLYKKEVWNIQFDDIYGVRTNLPLQFETKVIEILQLIRDSVIQVRTCDEVDIFTQINVKGLVKQLVQSLINSFLYALERSATNPVANNLNITEDNRSLVVLCNCSYTANYVLPKLYEIFEKYGYPDMSQVIQLTQKKFKDLENKLLDTFIERKRDEVIGGIETSMQFFDENWFKEKEMPKDVSYYVKETILNLIYVQSEIYKITPQLVYKTMFEILLSTVIEIERLCASYSKQLSDAARIQMLIDINAIDNVFKKTGQRIHSMLRPKIDNCRDLCNVTVQDQTIRKLIDDVTNRFCTSMRLQISCFNFNYDNLINTN